jgi:pyruvate dehydrogenase kinase 2/3/4
VSPIFADAFLVLSAQLKETIKHYSGFPATGVSLRQMVQFGSNPNTGM